MKRFMRASVLLGAAAGLAFRVSLVAQGGGAPIAGRPTTDQQMSGEAIFYQNCTFCHEHTGLKRRLIPQFLGPTLIGLSRTRPSLSNETVRALVMKGIPNRMTGFQYTLTSKEIDDLITYLKVR